MSGSSIRSGYSYFYPRSPCGERRKRKIIAAINEAFLSTLSLRRATESRQPCARPTTDFYPRSPCGERQRLWTMLYSCPGNFYPRSPCGERHLLTSVVSSAGNFYPRSPCGERPPVRDIIQWEGIFLSTLSLRRATETQKPNPTR